MKSPEASITVVRGNPTEAEVAAIVAALAGHTSPDTTREQPRAAPTVRRWGTPATNLGLPQTDPWTRALAARASR